MESKNVGVTKLYFSREFSFFQFLNAMEENKPVYENNAAYLDNFDDKGYPIQIDFVSATFRQKIGMPWGGSATISDKLKSIDWKYLEETKIDSSGLVLKKAIGKFGGRDYIAWYAPSIPYSCGPHKLHGLPGLIIEAYTTDKKSKFTFKSLTIYHSGKKYPEPQFGKSEYQFTYAEYCQQLDEFEQRLLIKSGGPDSGVVITRPKPDMQLEIGFKK